MVGSKSLSYVKKKVFFYKNNNKQINTIYINSDSVTMLAYKVVVGNFPIAVHVFLSLIQKSQQSTTLINLGLFSKFSTRIIAK